MQFDLIAKVMKQNFYLEKLKQITHIFKGCFR